MGAVIARTCSERVFFRNEQGSGQRSDSDWEETARLKPGLFPGVASVQESNQLRPSDVVANRTEGLQAFAIAKPRGARMGVIKRSGLTRAWLV